MKVALSRRGVLVIAAFLVSVPVSVQVESQAAASNAAVTTTLRRADGKPDLNGVWTAQLVVAGITGKINADGSVDALLTSRTGGLYALEIDGSVLRKGNRDKPMYRPEYWEKVRYLELNVFKEDPEFKCQPYGVPRIGAPQEIVQQDDRMVFLYSGGGSIPNPYRVIGMNRPHDPERVIMQASRGDSVGRWDGDTLVVDTTGLSDETWLTGRLGYFHTVDLHVVERFTRTGDTLKYEVIVEDPAVLLEPWVWQPRTLTRNPNPAAMLPEDYPCSERDAPYTKVR